MSQPTLHELTLRFFESFRDKAVFSTQEITDPKTELTTFVHVSTQVTFTNTGITEEFVTYLSTILNNTYIASNNLNEEFVNDYEDNSQMEFYIDVDYVEAVNENQEPIYCITIDNPVWVRDNLDEIINSYNVYLDDVPLSDLRKENGNFVFGPFNKDELQIFIEHHQLSLVLHGETETLKFDVEPIYDEDDEIDEDGNIIASYHNVHLDPDTYETVIQASGLKPIADTMLKVTLHMLPRGVTELRLC